MLRGGQLSCLHASLCGCVALPGERRRAGNLVDLQACGRNQLWALLPPRILSRLPAPPDHSLPRVALGLPVLMKLMGLCESGLSPSTLQQACFSASSELPEGMRLIPEQSGWRREGHQALVYGGSPRGAPPPLSCLPLSPVWTEGWRLPLESDGQAFRHEIRCLLIFVTSSPTPKAGPLPSPWWIISGSDKHMWLLGQSLSHAPTRAHPASVCLYGQPAHSL